MKTKKSWPSISICSAASSGAIGFSAMAFERTMLTAGAASSLHLDGLAAQRALLRLGALDALVVVFLYLPEQLGDRLVDSDVHVEVAVLSPEAAGRCR